jgi:2'-5' RNA ligase
LRRFTLCIFVDQLPEEGYEFDSRQWPLHITLIGNYFSANSDDIIQAIGNVTATYSNFEVSVGADAYFGSDNEILVSTIRQSENLNALHQAVVRAVAGCGVEFSNPSFLNVGYKPHITAQVSARKNEGDSIMVEHVSLVELEKDGIRHQRTVLKNFRLQRVGQ